LKSKKETVIVSASFSGIPNDKKMGDEMGQIPVLDTLIELVGDNRIARFDHLKFPKKVYNALSDKDYTLLINVYSGRKSSTDNLIEAGIVDKKASEFKDKRYVLNYKLIDEPASVAGSASDIVHCYLLPPVGPAPIKAIEILIDCDEHNNMKWGDKPIKDFSEFKKLMSTELNVFKKQGATVLPNLKVQGCMMGTSSELHTLFDEIKGAPIKPTNTKPQVVDGKGKKPKPVATAVSVPPPSVTLNKKGEITLAGKSVSLVNLKKELQAALTQYAVIPDKIDLKTDGETGMGMRADVNTKIGDAIAGAKWIRKKAALQALSVPISKKLAMPVQLEVVNYQTNSIYAFVVAKPRQTSGKPINYAKKGLVPIDEVFGLLKYEKGSWKVLDYSLGGDDKSFGCWWKKHNVPKVLFSKYIDVLCTGEKDILKNAQKS
jgi:hypothetical protein